MLEGCVTHIGAVPSVFSFLAVIACAVPEPSTAVSRREENVTGTMGTTERHG